MIKPLSSVKLPANECEIKQNWATSYRAAVRQRINSRPGNHNSRVRLVTTVQSIHVAVGVIRGRRAGYKQGQERVTNSNINSSKKTYN